MLERTARFYARGEKRHGLSPLMLADGTTAEIRLYDAIDSWGDPFGVSAKDFAKVIDELPDGTETINLRINSPGGEVFDALAIMNTLRAHSAKVVAYVDGIAASSASFIAASADETVMMPNAELMIHDAWGLAIGNAADMQKMADDLAHMSDNIADVYAAKSGSEVASWRDAMLAETWMTAEEAVAAGLADRVEKPTKAASTTKARFDLSIFNYAGRDNAPAPHSPVASASGHTSKKGDAGMAFTDEVRQRLGVTDADADEASILAALDETLSEQAEPEPTPAAVAVPDGAVVLDQATYDQLMGYGSQLQTLLDERATDRREGIVNAAVQAGKIPPARKQHFLDYLKVDEEGGKAQLDALQPGFVVPMAAIGENAGGDVSDEDTNYYALFPEERKGA